MKLLNSLILCIIALIFGILFFAYQKEWLIISTNFSGKYLDKNLENNKTLYKKNIKLFCFQNNKYKRENVEIIFSDNIEENIQKIVSNWLDFLQEEKIIEKVNLQNSFVSLSLQELYLSFDRPILSSELPTFEKLVIIESLLKTLRDNDIKLSKIYFLINNQEMVDAHLDFSNPWPIEGFFQT